MVNRIGIDPGLGGAIALLRDGKVVVVDMPTVARSAGKGAQVDAAGLAELLRPCAFEGGWHTYVEIQHARPGQGVTSMFGMGVSFGAAVGVIAALGIPYTLVAPGAWKRQAGLTGKDKEASRARALQLHPELAERLSRKKDHGRAEAVLLACFGRPNEFTKP